MPKRNNPSEDFITDPALGGTSPRQRQGARTPRPRPVPDSEGPRTSPAPRKKRPAPSADRYTFISFLRDYRVHLAVGLVLCTVALLMAVSTISFLFNAAADQSVLHGRGVQEIVESGDKVNNIGGIVGAKIAEWLMVDTFGIASFVVVAYLALLGLACMRVRRTGFFSLTFRCLFTTVAVSVIAGLCTYNSEHLFYLGGTHGHYVNTLVMTYADVLGAFGLSVLLAGLLVAVFLHPLRAMVKWVGALIPERKPKAEPAEAETTDEASVDEVFADEAFADASFVDEPAAADDKDNADIPAGHERFMPPQVDVFDEAAKDEAAAAPAEPELVIVKNAIEEEEAPAEPARRVIRDGDHIGIDEPFDVRASHSNYEFPPLDLLAEHPKTFVVDEAEQQANKELIVNALRSYNIEIVRIEATIGPTVTLYEIVPAQGTRISKIKSLEDDIAMSLSALGIRIIAPIPGKGTIGIEVPNSSPQIVSMRTVLESRKFRETNMRLPMALGATISNEIFMADLTKMPHLLVAGATGQGKSVGLNCIITSLLYSKHPDELKFVLVDPKMVEFSLYQSIDRQFLAKIPDEEKAVITDPNKALETLNSLCVEMDRRYELLQDARVRSVEDYNERYTARMLNPEKGHRYLPYIVIIVDEYADLLMVAGSDIQKPICRIAQKARAVGMHMIIATQRPTANVVTGMIKANFPARMAFKVTQGNDSKTILDRTGAQRLIGRGDMLMLIGSTVERVQCALVETPEVDAICQHVGAQPGFTACYELPEPPTEDGGEVSSTADMKIDDEFRRCAMFIASQTSASITSMQRNFSLGFNKAGRYMDQMQRLGIVGPANGAKPRQVLMTPDQVERILE